MTGVAGGDVSRAGPGKHLPGPAEARPPGGPECPAPGPGGPEVIGQSLAQVRSGELRFSRCNVEIRLHP